MSNFNGQINISRDLRQNKQTVIGKYDLIDITFLGLGLGTAIIVAYFLGFSLIKIVDEFTAIIISIAPMILIISFGFKRVAGIRKFNFMRMKFIDKKSKYRFNRKRDKSQVGDRFLAGFEIDRRYVNKYINKFLSYDNLSVLSVRYVKDAETSKQRIYFILGLSYRKDESIFKDVINKFSLNNEIKALSVDDIYELEENNRLRFEAKTDYKNKSKKSILTNLFNKQIPEELKEKDTDINLKVKYNNKAYKILMLNLYNVKVYRIFINKVKLYADVLCYFKREGKTKFVNTFLVVEDEIKRGKKLTKLEKIEKLSNEYGIILDKLSREQNAGKSAISYLLTNFINAYRVYK